MAVVLRVRRGRGRDPRGRLERLEHQPMLIIFSGVRSGNTWYIQQGFLENFLLCGTPPAEHTWHISVTRLFPCIYLRTPSCR